MQYTEADSLTRLIAGQCPVPPCSRTAHVCTGNLMKLHPEWSNLKFASYDLHRFFFFFTVVLYLHTRWQHNCTVTLKLPAPATRSQLHQFILDSWHLTTKLLNDNGLYCVCFQCVTCTLFFNKLESCKIASNNILSIERSNFAEHMQSMNRFPLYAVCIYNKCFCKSSTRHVQTFKNSLSSFTINQNNLYIGG